MNIYPLFSTPVFHDTIDCHINFEYIKNLKYKRYEDNSGFGSFCQKILLEKEMQDLKEKIEIKLNHYYHEILQFGEGKLTHIISWVNKHNPGDYASKHLHENSFFSGIFYLKCNSNSGKIWMYQNDGYNTISSPTVCPSIKNFNVFNSKKWAIQPKQNDIILFPSHLSHSVDSNQSIEDRYSIAFNYFVEGFVGSDYRNVNLTIH